MDKIYVPVLCLFLCLMLESGYGEKIYIAETSFNSTENRRNAPTNAMYTEEQFSKAELYGLLPCPDCYKRKTLLHTSIADKINSSVKAISTVPQGNNNDAPSSKIVSKESEKVEFSRKYNPDIRSDDEGFVPVPGPYGMKTRLARANALKPSAVNTYKSGSASRNVNGALKNSHVKNHSPRNIQNKRPQSVQRRIQYRNPKVHDELTVKESVANENILGNGNFEIIRGGIYSDQDTNEILGSRRMGRGFGSYVVPTYRQNRFNVVQNVQFPPFYQGRVQNPLHPMFYPRAPY